MASQLLDWFTRNSGLLVAGILGGTFTFSALVFERRLIRAHEKRRDDAQIEGFLQAIATELETLRARYNETAGARIEALEAGKPLHFYYPAYGNYFSVYEGSTSLLGRVSDRELRARIVRAYVLLKAMIDSMHFNNRLFEKKDDAAMAEFGHKLKALHQTLNAELNAVVRDINGR